ncbi:bifunctional diguanylate cyclase/phosphodiesterase [Rheinheimera texasensis]|uniref:bifunctional diguanylate cyclase/phosphodiesterase n=1 Tax=Rheinheimera texasensis TaxID=306205 RepID=UPI0004E21054|nr:EAL domain-containing protein [Rheinheimera texasensis]
MEPQFNQQDGGEAAVVAAGEQSEIRQLRQEVATLRTLNTLALDLQSVATDQAVYQQVVQLVSEALGFADCSLFVPDATGLLRRVAACGLRALDLPPPLYLDSDSLIATAARQQQIICVADTSQDPRYVSGNSQFASELAVPVLCAGKLMAVLDCEHPQQGFFADKIALLTQVAEVLARKMEQLAGLAHIQHSVTQLEYASRLQKVLFNIASLQYDGEAPGQFYQQLHQNVNSLIYAENFFIALYDSDTEVLHFPYFADSHEHISPDQFYPKEILNHSLTGYVFRTDKPLLADKAMLAELDRENVVKAYGEQPEYWLGVPFKSEDRVQGVVVVQSYDVTRHYQQTDLDLLLFVSQHICSALERVFVQQRLLHQALHDALTNLPNRVLFLDRVRQGFKRRRRYPNHVVAVAYLDLDRFKMVNDTLGHQIGDEFLVAVAQLLRRCLRQNDTLARLGGDEFAILLDDVHTESDVAEVMQRISLQLSQPILLKQHKLQTSASIGVALADPHTVLDDTDELIRRADIAMYQAKQDGRGVCRFFSAEMDQRAVQHYQLEMEIQAALSTQQFELHYQPVVNLDNDDTVGFEALIRWQHPERGFIPPNDFIPLAEELGLLGDIDRYVVRQAVSQINLWWQNYATPFYISVNISGRSFSQADFADVVLQQLADAQVPARYLAIEITERALIDKIDQAKTTIAQLRSAGIRVFLDDFGTGYSSLSYLHEFQLDVLKIDRSFIAGIRPRIQENAVVNTIITLAKTLKLQVIAEGIENSLQRKILSELGCESGQGYWFAAALPPRQAVEWLR